MFKRKNGHYKIILVSFAAIFALGLILGTLAMFYVPDDIAKEAAEALKIPVEDSFVVLLKENFSFELLWSLVLWVLGSSAVTAPFTGAIITLRGFVIGFSVAFISTKEFNNLLFLFGSILPQCMTALPFMSLVAMLCLIHARDKKYNESTGLKYFLYGAGIVCLSFLVAVAESGLMILANNCF